MILQLEQHILYRDRVNTLYLKDGAKAVAIAFDGDVKLVTQEPLGGKIVSRNFKIFDIGETLESKNHVLVGDYIDSDGYLSLVYEIMEEPTIR